MKRLAYLSLFGLCLTAASVQADIFQWEYINPADPSQGKRQSATLAADGAGVDAVPGADLHFRNLTMAYLIGADLRNALVSGSRLTDADLSQANLTSANFTGTEFSGADVTNAVVLRAYLGDTGITLAQLYSTASYKAQNLTGIYLTLNDLSGGNFAGQNLTDANFGSGNLTDADFSQANLTNADLGAAKLTDADLTGAHVQGARFGSTGITLAQLYSTVSFRALDLSGLGLGNNDLAGGNFAGQNLTNASFYRATLAGADFREANLTNASFDEAVLTDADFTDAKIRGARFARVQLAGPCRPCGFSGTGITLPQLYSTASYQSKDLTGISFHRIDLAGGNFAGQNLANANLYFATLTSANLTGADVRGPEINGLVGVNLAGAITTNLISRNGHISGLELVDGGLLVVRDYDGDFRHSEPFPPIPISVDEHLSMGPGATLRLVFEADAWDSTISFAPGIPVTRGGTLELTFANDVNLASQIGRTLKIFDWTGVNPTGAFTIVSPYAWDLSNLYTAGEITLAAIPEPTTIPLLLFGVLLSVLLSPSTRCCVRQFPQSRSPCRLGVARTIGGEYNVWPPGV